MEEIKRKVFSELLRLGLPMGSFILIISEDEDAILVKAFNLSIYQGRLPTFFEGTPILYESRI